MTVDELLERTQWDFFWVPPGVKVVDRPELAYLSSARDEVLFNSVTRTRAPPARLPTLVAEVSTAHAGVRSRWLVPPSLDRPALEKALRAGGYAPAAVHHGYVSSVEGGPRGRPASGFRVRRVDGEQTLRDCIAVAGRAFGENRAPTAEQIVHELAACADPGGRVHRFVAYDAAGQPVSSGGMSAFPALAFGWLFAGATLPEARGRGAYSAVLAARVEAARRLGLTRVGLYARVDTSAPIVARQGFERHGPMAYWERIAR